MREVGPGGHFFGCAHTQARYRTAFYAPMISDWRNYESWREAGSPTAYDTANRLYKERLAAYEEPPMDPAIQRGARRLRRPPQGRRRRADRFLIAKRARRSRRRLPIAEQDVSTQKD